ncbi:MAG: YlxR family protein [Clostridiales bacterium]|jgi:predicted RNA-binding protein YlxR (DUF448 family)|nr:YlxR family protein [Clostridiales bacterium]
MPGPKKIPMRQCTGCREMKPKKELLRVVRTPGGEVLLDTTGRTNGRGAYICPDGACLKKAVRSKALSRAFGVSVPDGVIASLEQKLESADE